MKQKLLIIFLSLLFLCPVNLNAMEEKKINLYLFYGKECPHCEKEITYLTNYLSKENNIKLYKYEIWHNKKNQNKYKEAQKLLNTKSTGVPYLVVGSKVIIGFMENYSESIIEEAIDYYKNNDYKDILGEKLKISTTNNDVTKIKIPFVGEVNPQNVSLFLLAIIIGFIDGFNPCAMWVLLFLISILLGVNERKKMWILGSTFILTSSIIYLLFMISWLNLAYITNKVVLIRILIGLFAIIFGIINLSKYLKNKKATGCEVTSSKDKKKIMQQVKNIVANKKFILAIMGIIVLAISINAIELLCSLGLPLIYTQVLSMNELSVIEYILYLLVYILFFSLDDIIIFTLSMKFLKVKAISNKYAKYSHFIGGIIMIIIGILLIIFPSWLMFNF